MEPAIPYRMRAVLDIDKSQNKIDIEPLGVAGSLAHFDP